MRWLVVAVVVAGLCGGARADTLDPGSPTASREIVHGFRAGDIPKDEAQTLVRENVKRVAARGRIEAIRAMAIVGLESEAQDTLAAWRGELRTKHAEEPVALHLLAIELAVLAAPNEPHTDLANEVQHFCVDPPLEAELWCYRARTTATPNLDRLREDAETHDDAEGGLETFEEFDAQRFDLGNKIARRLRFIHDDCHAPHGYVKPVLVTLQFQVGADTAYASGVAGTEPAAQSCVLASFQKDDDVRAFVRQIDLTVKLSVVLEQRAATAWRKAAVLPSVYAVGLPPYGGGAAVDGALDLVQLGDELALTSSATLEAGVSHGHRSGGSFTDERARGMVGLRYAHGGTQTWLAVLVGGEADGFAFAHGATRAHLPFELRVHPDLGASTIARLRPTAWFRGHPNGDLAGGLGIDLPFWSPTWWPHVSVDGEQQDGVVRFRLAVGIPLRHDFW